MFNTVAMLRDDLQEYERREQAARKLWARNPTNFRAMDEADRCARRIEKILNELREPAI